MSNKIACDVIPNNTISQRFRAEEGYISSVSIMLGTYSGDRKGRLNFKLYEIKRRKKLGFSFRLSKPTPLAEATEQGEVLLDNTEFNFNFRPIKLSAGKEYLIEISHGGGEASSPAVWLSSNSERIAGHQACFVGSESLGDFGLNARIRYSPPLASTPVPQHILYSPVTQCNLNCIHCISRETRLKISKLSNGIKSEIQRWCREGNLRAIATDYSGDILWADERFGGELDFLIGLQVPFHVDTNGACLNPKTIDKLLASKMGSINISIDTPDPATYKWIRKGAPPLNEILDNIRTLVAMTESSRSSNRFDITISFTIMKSTLGQWEDFVRLAADLGIKTAVARHLEVYTSDLEKESLWFDQARHNDAQAKALKVAAELDVQMGMQGPFEPVSAGTGKRYCDAAWNSAVILGNGDVQVCCMPKTKIGNLHEQTMEEIWAGPAYQAFRSRVNSDTPPMICQICPMFRHSNNMMSYIPHRELENCIPPYQWEVPSARLNPIAQIGVTAKNLFKLITSKWSLPFGL